MKNNNTKLITFEETKELIDSLLMGAEYHPRAIYGLMFMFNSFFKAVHSDNKMHVSNICEEMIRELYIISINASVGERNLLKVIHKAYRNADFSQSNQVQMSQIFVEAEKKGGNYV